ncbi:Hypothetical_protein [Hexamita inflata]|uniref:Hypothetical_protein n=1 Tax=Hexamita inflata TaxID=28002 RepID=A0ABP1GUW8_9EUKA
MFVNKRDALRCYQNIQQFWQQQYKQVNFTKQGQRYTEEEKQTALLQYITYHRQGYNLQRQIDSKNHQQLPSLRTVQRLKQKLLKDYEINDANIGYVFDKEMLKTIIPQWKIQNKIADNEEVIVNVSQDAMAITGKVKEIDGVLQYTIQEQDGNIYPVSHVFVYIMSAEKEYSFLPIFSQFASSGATNIEQMITWYAIRAALKEYSIIVRYYPHDGDQWFSRLDSAELQVIKTNYIDFMKRNPYQMTENYEQICEKLNFQFKEIISMPDSKHLLKIIRNLINTQLKVVIVSFSYNGLQYRYYIIIKNIYLNIIRFNSITQLWIRIQVINQ